MIMCCFAGQISVETCEAKQARLCVSETVNKLQENQESVT